MHLRASQVYMWIAFISSLARATMFTTYGIYVISELGLSPLELLVVGTVLEVTVLVFEGITGVVADTYGRRRSVIIGMFILGAGFALKGSVQGLEALVPIVSVFIWLLITEVIDGIGYTFISGADQAWVVDEVGEKNVGSLFMAAKRISLVATLIGIALSVGLSTLSPNLTYVVGGLMFMGLGAFLVFFMKETQFVKPERDAASSHWRTMKSTWLSGANVIRRQPLLLLILIVTLFSGAASEGYDRLWEAHLIMEVGFPEMPSVSMAMWFGIIAVITTLLGLFAVRIAERRLDMADPRAILTAMVVLTGMQIAGIASFALSPNFAWALGSLLFIGIVRTLAGPIYDTWLNLNVDSKVRATVLSMMSQSDALGQTGGGPLVGWIGNRWSVRASLLAAAALLLPILGVFSRALRKR